MVLLPVKPTDRLLRSIRSIGPGCRERERTMPTTLLTGHYALRQGTESISAPLIDSIGVTQQFIVVVAGKTNRDRQR